MLHSKTATMARAVFIWCRRACNFGIALLATLVCTIVSAQTSVSITSPGQGAVMNGPATPWQYVDVVGNFSGSSLATITVFNGWNSTVLAKQTSSTTYAAKNVPLAPGPNTLTVTALDRNGTSATASVTVISPRLGVVMTSPAKGSTFTAPPSLTLEASAQVLPGNVQRVEYYLLNGGLIGNATTPPYTYVWNSPPTQTLTLFARVIDDAGRQSDSAGVVVTVSPPNQPPVVSLTAPTNGAVYQAPASFTLQASASDPDGTVSLVEFLNNGNFLGATNTSPYTFALSGQPAGNYSFTARATDNQGAKTTSAPVAVTVSPSAPPTVSLTSPTAGSSYLVPANIQVSANAASTGGSITKVDFAATSPGAPPVTASVTSPPYTATLPVTQGGTYTLSAIAYDSNGISATSSPVTVSVSDGVTYLHNDFAGTPIAATDSAGAVIWKENYRPYGSRNVNAPAEAGNRLAFHGKPADQETGLSYFGARYYDPVTGRFMGTDPQRFSEDNLQSFNRYAYGNNNPYKYADPDGRNATLVLQTGVAVVLAGVALTPEQREQMLQGGKRAIQATRDALARLRNWVFNEANEAANGAGEEGCVYCVKGDKTSSGKDYIGSTDDMGNRKRDKSDGRDREGAEVIDTYPKGDRDARRKKEQQAINDRGGVDNLDNKRNEVSPKNWPSKGISPP